MRLSHLDFDALQQTLLALYEFRELDSFRETAPRLLLKLIPAANFAWPEYGVDQASGGSVLVDCVELNGTVLSERLDWAARNLDRHPFWDYFMKAPTPSSVRMSDLLSLRQFRDTMAYQEFYRLLGYDRELASLVAPRWGAGPAAISFVRRGRDFTERDRLLLSFICRHFNQAHRNAQLVSAWIGRLDRPTAGYHLTPRESEVATWLAKGKTNAEIAIILESNPRTIEKHVEKILEKLGVENRTAAAILISEAADRVEPT